MLIYSVIQRAFQIYFSEQPQSSLEGLKMYKVLYALDNKYNIYDEEEDIELDDLQVETIEKTL